MDNNTLTRKYWTFYGVSRALHQSVNTDFDVQQFCFENARLVKCIDGDGTTTSFGKGWLCVTVIQNGGTSGEKPQQRPGCLSLDVTIENTVETLSGRGMVLKNKNVSSVVGNSGPHDSSLLTVLIEGNNIQVTQVKHCVRSVDAGSQASSSGASSSSIAAAASSASSEEKRARSEHRREHKKQQQMLQQQHQQANSMVDGSSSGGGSNGQVRVSGGPEGRDPRMLNRPKERRPDADDKRQKTHHDHSKNDSEHPPPRLAPESDPVAFLNFSHAPSLMDAGGDGALLNDTSGFGDAAGEPAEAQSAAPALGNSGAEVGPIIDDGVRASTSTAAHLSPATSESSSNCPVPPNPQASTITDPISPLPPPPRSPPFEDIIQSLTRLINECSKDVPNIPPLPTRRVSECESRAATPVSSTSTTNAGASTSNANAAPDVPRPVCEIRPYMVTPAAPPPQQQPEQAAGARRTRGGARPRNGSRGGGGGRRSSASSSSRRRRRNRDDDESEDEILPGPSRRRAVPPSLVEDGLEIIDADEEVALAAASIASFFD
ncbi:Ba144/Ba145 [Baboon cytomegalovirus]|nr:Ba144/Ba145 [Baboon cytomegalovirus]